MPLLVYKFGGTSLKDEPSRAAAINKIKQALDQGHRLIVVVSAMGRKGEPYATDTLLSLVRPEAPAMLKDFLISTGEIISACVLTDALQKEGIEARAMGAWQAGIYTDKVHGNAEVKNMDTALLQWVLDQGVVPVVTGFQGAFHRQITTLGRGGSDTSAVEIGGYMKADEVHIFTDVIGVATIDPRLSEQARFLAEMSLEDMHFLAEQGAGVVHPRAIATAMKHGMSLRVRSTFSDEPGTLISAQNESTGLVGVAARTEGEHTILSFVCHGPVPDMPDATALGEDHYQVQVPHAEKEQAIRRILALEKRQA